MNAPSSGQTDRSIYANKRTIHPDDEGLLQYLLRELNQSRVRQGITLAEAARRAGREAAWLSLLFNGTSSVTSLEWNYAYRLAAGLGYVLRMEFNGASQVLPMFKIGSMMRLVETLPELGGVAMLEYLRAYRRYMEVEQKSFMESQGLSRSSAWSIENSDNPRIATVMRYARALGGRITFELEPRPYEQEDF